MSAIIVTDDYLCYKAPKSPYNFFLILIFNELFKYKTSDEWQHWKTRTSSLHCKDINLQFTESQISLRFLYNIAATFRLEN